MGAISVQRKLDKADELYKQANRMSKRNPRGADRLKVKAQIMENKAISSVGRAPSTQSRQNSGGSGGKSISLNWG